ncbi:glycoside hydrolase [Amylostereum chailletii]|nr:glycoside hydrolase [Amylostereum chailletii]
MISLRALLVSLFALSAFARALPQPEVLNDNQTTGQKYVVAHVIVGNLAPYTIDNWKSDINLAQANGLDGFVLNTGAGQQDRVSLAFQAAQELGTGFKLFMSFDMSAMPCATEDDAAVLRKYITDYAQHPNQLIYKGRVYATTFAGQECKFGQGSVVTGWATQFSRHPDLTGMNRVYFVPGFFIDPATFPTYNDVIDGSINWNSAWPTSITAENVGGLSQAQLDDLLAGTATDNSYLSGLASMSNSSDKGYLPTVSPWFFTHYSPQTFNKNWVYYGDSHMYAKRWESLVSRRDQFDIVEVVTWNDFGESHYIGPIEGAQPNSQAWVDGFDHTAWLGLTNYYAQAFKAGSFPAITEDKLYMWARPNPKDATTTDDSVGQPTNFEMETDTVWVVALTTAAATVTLSTTSSDAKSSNVSAGLSKLSIPISAGGIMHGQIVRNGQVAVDLQPAGFTFNSNPTNYNYNAFVATN